MPDMLKESQEDNKKIPDMLTFNITLLYISYILFNTVLAGLELLSAAYFQQKVTAVGGYLHSSRPP